MTIKLQKTNLFLKQYEYRPRTIPIFFNACHLTLIDQYPIVVCPKCKTQYPVINGAPKCNNRIIRNCPYCK